MRPRRGFAAALVLPALLTLFPLVVTLAGSLSTGEAIAMSYSSRLTTFDLVQGLVQGDVQGEEAVQSARVIKEKFQRFMLIPRPFSLEQYREVLINQPAFLVLLFNSLKITLPVVLGSLGIGLLTAYGFTRWKWKYREAVFAVYVVVMLMPLQAVLVPNYVIASLLGIRRSYLAIILPGIFSPFGVFLMRQSLRSMPEAYFEAAEIDGAGSWYILWYIVLPQLTSSAAALAMLVFIEYWNLVEQAVIFIDDFRREPLSVYLSRLAGDRTALVFAASCVYLFLPVWFLCAGQKNLERGIELSGVK
jgi:multiple sugar transport system permease protein